MQDTKLLDYAADPGAALAEAARILLAGDVVAFPTETVYGVGALIFDAAAARKVYEAKSRSFTNPLAAHISSLEDVGRLAREIPDDFYKLAGKFLPGPLSIVLNKLPAIPDEVTAGLGTIGIRFPDCKPALELISLVGQPLAATSANVSGEPAAVTGAEAHERMRGRIAATLDAGATPVGKESTVITLAGARPRLLRLGAISLDELEETLGKKFEL